MDGYIYLWRCLMDDALWQKKPFDWGRAWVDLLMLATYKESCLWVRSVKIRLKRGEVGWSELKLAERWGWTRTGVRTFLKYLKNEQQIEQQKNRLSSIITIINYDKYQPIEQQNEQQMNNKRTTNEQQMNTNNKDIPIEGKKKSIYAPDSFPYGLAPPDRKGLPKTYQGVVDYFTKRKFRNPEETARKFLAFYGGLDWHKGNTPIGNWIMIAVNWEDREGKAPSNGSGKFCSVCNHECDDKVYCENGIRKYKRLIPGTSEITIEEQPCPHMKQ